MTLPLTGTGRGTEIRSKGHEQKHKRINLRTILHSTPSPLGIGPLPALHPSWEPDISGIRDFLDVMEYIKNIGEVGHIRSISSTEEQTHHFSILPIDEGTRIPHLANLFAGLQYNDVSPCRDHLVTESTSRISLMKQTHFL